MDNFIEAISCYVPVIVRILKYLELDKSQYKINNYHSEDLFAFKNASKLCYELFYTHLPSLTLDLRYASNKMLSTFKKAKSINLYDPKITSKVDENIKIKKICFYGVINNFQHFIGVKSLEYFWTSRCLSYDDTDRVMNDDTVLQFPNLKYFGIHTNDNLSGEKLHLHEKLEEVVINQWKGVKMEHIVKLDNIKKLKLILIEVDDDSLVKILNLKNLEKLMIIEGNFSHDVFEKNKITNPKLHTIKIDWSYDTGLENQGFKYVGNGVFKKQN